MKKYIIIVSTVILLILFADTAYYRLGWYIDFNPNKKTDCFITTSDEKIIITENGQEKELFIKGVDISSSIPGKWSTEQAIDKQTYLEWFRKIQDMGANTIRIYSVYSDDFYNAFYEFNTDNSTPLYLIQGAVIDDYTNNCHVSALDKSFKGQLLDNAITAVDVIHGRKKMMYGKRGVHGSGNFDKDISRWVIGYIFGIDWDATTVAYTNEMYGHIEEKCTFLGEYMYTTEDASPFEAMLAEIGDEVFSYESKKYKSQRLVSFSNYAITDPFEYNDEIKKFFTKIDGIDVENIKTSDKVLSGQFASYSVFPYFPDYLRYFDTWQETLGICKEDFTDQNGNVNNYRAYLTALTKHHTTPVVIVEFGTSTARTMSYSTPNADHSSGMNTESRQGEIIAKCYEDIVASGTNGCLIYQWQDDWSKKTWNTMHAVDLGRTPYWSDFQTGEQFFGLLTFDPGKEESICYVDGDISEWNDEQRVIGGEYELYTMYDEKFIYFLVKKENLDFENDTIYIPIDTTPKTGSNYCQNYNLKFDREVDFLITINGENNSKVEVQERYDALRSTYSNLLYKYNTYQKKRVPDANSPEFVPINLLLEKVKFEDMFIGENVILELQARGEHEAVEQWRKPITFETGKLTYGNANPKSDNFNSIADFYCNGDCVEIRIPWQMLNFSDPSEMQIHDDYYDGNFGIEYIYIDSMFVGINNTKKRIKLSEIELSGWGKKTTTHERLKESYYTVQQLWKENEQ